MRECKCAEIRRTLKRIERSGLKDLLTDCTFDAFRTDSPVPQMLGNEEVTEKLAEKAMEKFEERLDHEVNRILNGWRR